MAKQTAGHDETARHDETDNRAWRNRQPGMTKQPSMAKQTTEHGDPPVIAGCDRQSHKSNRHPNLSASHPRPVQQSSTTYPPVTPDLSNCHPGPVQQSYPTCPAVIPDLIGDLRAFGLAPGARRKDAKRMIKSYSLTQRTA